MEFNLAALEDLPTSKFERVLLSYLHYRSTYVLRLDSRFVLARTGELCDTQTQKIIASVNHNGAVFYSEARFLLPLISKYILPYQLTVIDGMWIAEIKGRRLIYRDGVTTANMYHLNGEVSEDVKSRFKEIEDYVSSLDLASEAKRHSFDLCQECGRYEPGHLDFHMFRKEIGNRLLGDLTGMVNGDGLQCPVAVARQRLVDVMRLIRSSSGFGRPTPYTEEGSEQYFYSDCPWSGR